MTRVALRGLLGRKLRTTLTALAIVLGVAMVSGTYVLTDTISHAFDSIFTGSYRNTSAIITGKELVKESASGTATIPASVLDKVKPLPGVAAASGAIFDVRGSSDLAKLIDKKGKVISTGGAPTFGWGIDADQPRFNPFTLVKGNWAAGPDQVVIDAGTAKKKHFRVGDRIGVSAQGPVRQFRISGVAKFGSVDSIGGATFAIFQVPTAQALLNKQGQFDSIFLAAAPGVSAADLVRQVRPLLPASAEVRTASQQAKADAKDTREGAKFIQYFLLAFGGIALLVGAFVIFNTLSMTVAQRVRELATLRTLGASRRQVLRSVLLEGVITGVLASLLGLVLGIALAKGLNAVFVAIGIDLPRKGTVLKSRTVIVSLLLGIVITTLATISPARRATRIAPILAVREGATLPRSRLAGNLVAAAVVLALAVVLLAYGLFAAGLSTGVVLLSVGIGCIGLFVGVGMLAFRLVPGIASVVGAPAEWLGGATGRLARENATRNPIRTARTAGALMIGLALVTAVATLGSGLRTTVKDSLRSQVEADYVVTSKNGFDTFVAKAGDAVGRAPGVAIASNVRSDKARAFGHSASVTGIDPATVGRVYAFRWTKRSSAAVDALARDGAIVKKRFAKKHHLGVGSPLTLTTPAGKRLSFVVAGIFDPPGDQLDPLLGDVSISQQAFDQRFPRPANALTLVDVSGGATPAATAALRRAAGPYPDVRVRTKADWVDKRSAGLNQILNIFYVLLALSVIISLFGMVNALVLAVFERTREVGMLRAVGMTRRQTRRMVRHESIITALIGAALGLPLGVSVAGAVTRALRGQDVSFSLPVATLVIFAVFAAIAGVIAAILPARRAARLNVLEALQYE